MSDITIKSYDSGRQPEGPLWSTVELQQDFEVIGFAAPFVTVRRKSDGIEGTLEFTHAPRLYFNFQAK